MIISRIDNYDVKLVQWANRMSGLSYEWGVTDCGALIRTACHIMYDYDLFQGLPYWDSKLTALKTLKSVGSISNALKSIGAFKLHISQAQAGDFIIESKPDINGMQSTVIVITTIQYLVTDPKGICSLIRKEDLDKASFVLRLPHGIELNGS